MPTPPACARRWTRARLADLAPDSRANFIGTLADALRFVARRGHATRPACWSRTWA